MFETTRSKSSRKTKSNVVKMSKEKRKNENCLKYADSENEYFDLNILSKNEAYFISEDRSLNKNKKTSFFKKIKLFFSKKNETKVRRKNDGISTIDLRKCMEDGVIVPHLLNSHCAPSSFCTISENYTKKSTFVTENNEKTNLKPKDDETKKYSIGKDNEITENVEQSKEEATQTLMLSTDKGIQAFTSPHFVSSHKDKTFTILPVCKSFKHNINKTDQSKFKLRVHNVNSTSNVNKDMRKKRKDYVPNFSEPHRAITEAKNKNMSNQAITEVLNNQKHKRKHPPKNNKEGQPNNFHKNPRRKEFSIVNFKGRNMTSGEALKCNFHLKNKSVNSLEKKESIGGEFSQHERLKKSFLLFKSQDFKSLPLSEHIPEKCNINWLTPKEKAELKNEYILIDNYQNLESNYNKLQTAREKDIGSYVQMEKDAPNKIQKFKNSNIKRLKNNTPKIQEKIQGENIFSTASDISESTVYKSSSTSCIMFGKPISLSSFSKDSNTPLNILTKDYNQKPFDTQLKKMPKVQESTENNMSLSMYQTFNRLKKPKGKPRQPFITQPNSILSNGQRTPSELTTVENIIHSPADNKSSEILRSINSDFVGQNCSSGIFSSESVKCSQIFKMLMAEKSEIDQTYDDFLLQRNDTSTSANEEHYKLNRNETKLEGQFGNINRRDDKSSQRNNFGMLHNDANIFKVTQTDTCNSCLNISVKQFEALMSNRCVTLSTNAVYDTGKFLGTFTFQEQGLPKVDTLDKSSIQNFHTFKTNPTYQQQNFNKRVKMNKNIHQYSECDENSTYNPSEETININKFKNTESYITPNKHRSLSKPSKNNILKIDNLKPIIFGEQSTNIPQRTRHKHENDYLIGVSRMNYMKKTDDASGKQGDPLIMQSVHGVFSGNISQTSDVT